MKMPFYPPCITGALMGLMGIVMETMNILMEIFQVVFVYCPASNSFFLPSIPDMASTFFLQSVTSSFCSNREKSKPRFGETEIVSRARLITADCGITPL